MGLPAPSGGTAESRRTYQGNELLTLRRPSRATRESLVRVGEFGAPSWTREPSYLDGLQGAEEEEEGEEEGRERRRGEEEEGAEEEGEGREEGEEGKGGRDGGGERRR